MAEVAKEKGVHVVLVSSALVTPKNRFSPIRLILNNIRWGLMDAKVAPNPHNCGSPLTCTVDPEFHQLKFWCRSQVCLLWTAPSKGSAAMGLCTI